MPVLSDVESNCAIAVSQNTKCKGMCSLRRRDRSLEPDMSTIHVLRVRYNLQAVRKSTTGHGVACGEVPASAEEISLDPVSVFQPR
jgi:hypothetical protein